MTPSPPLQSLPPRTAARVEARGWSWLRYGAIASGPLTRVHVAPLSADAPDLDTLLQPFDVVREPGPARARHVSRHWLRRWIGGWPAAALPALDVTAGLLGTLLPFPHQLSPAAAVVSGAAARLLLSDEVGAGKTIEAGLIVAELARRKAADRVLVLTPSTIRDQWAGEVTRLAGLSLDVVDRTAFRLRGRDAPPGLGPFDVPARVVMSMDLAKRADVLAQLVAVTWDVLVVDEAHLASGDSARMAAVQALGCHARVVVLATATPHGGDTGAFARLCRIGELDDAPLMRFERPAPRVVGRGTLKVATWSPRRTAAERAMAESLGRYVRRLDGSGSAVARLIGIVLRKRALSSPHALACSLRHRERVLSDRAHPGAQACLPFDDEEQDCGDLAQPPALGEATLLDTAGEGELLRDALSKARLAAGRWSKVAPLVRLLQRTQERVLVFTEYRDTLEALVAALPGEVAVVELHGGLARRERVEVIDRFVAGHARVLVATDVAAEGLNLQRGCRLVVHLELPWSPTRITQRNGRVDRIGQQRQVHVWRLLGDRRHEARVVAALAARLERMREAGVNAVGFGDRNAGGPAASEPPDAATRHQPDPCDLALAHDRHRIAHLVRACGRWGRAGMTRRLDGLAWRWLRRPLDGLGRGVILICLTPAATRGACPSLVALHVSLRQWPTAPPRDWLPALAAHAACAVPHDRRLSDALSRRESRLLAHALDEHARAAGRWQASLFERRAARLVAATRDRARDRIDAHRVRLQELGAGSAPAVPVVALLVK